LYINWEKTRSRGRPRNRWQDEVREDGRMVSGKVWQEKVTPGRNGRGILHMPMEFMNKRSSYGYKKH
jgi:hypothetical protein